jgi:hypothetical protein
MGKMYERSVEYLTKMLEMDHYDLFLQMNVQNEVASHIFTALRYGKRNLQEIVEFIPKHALEKCEAYKDKYVKRRVIWMARMHYYCKLFNEDKYLDDERFRKYDSLYACFSSFVDYDMSEGLPLELRVSGLAHRGKRLVQLFLELDDIQNFTDIVPIEERTIEYHRSAF